MTNSYIFKATEREKVMEKRIIFGAEESAEPFRIYSIVKRERRPRSLLARPMRSPDFSWPPKRPCMLVSDAARDEGDKK